MTYLGYVHGTMAALRRMRSRDRGTIVQVGSALAYRGIPLQTAYCGAKHAIQGFHESLRCELLHERSDVRVTMVQMPAVNTPQFSWVLSRLPRQAQPVPPIYQPEVAARAVLYAADHPRRREYWVGGTTVATLVANAVAPGLLDRYLARTGFGSQQTNQPREPDQPANLWEPADRDETSAPTGASTSGPPRAARSCGPPSTTGWSAQRSGCGGRRRGHGPGGTAVRRVLGLPLVGMALRRGRRLPRPWRGTGKRCDRPADTLGTNPDHADHGGRGSAHADRPRGAGVPGRHRLAAP